MGMKIPRGRNETDFRMTGTDDRNHIFQPQASVQWLPKPEGNSSTYQWMVTVGTWYPDRTGDVITVPSEWKTA